MNKIIAFLISVVMIYACFIPIASAEISDDTYGINTQQGNLKKYETLDASAVILSCNYSDDFNSIEIQGNISHKILITYGKYRLEILRIAPNESIDDAIMAEEPDIAASMDIASNFEFSVKIKTATDRFSKYAVILRADGKNTVLASKPQYVYAPSSDEGSSANKNDFKGISISNSSDISLSGDMGFGSVVIPVYYSRLISEASNGYLYPHEDTYCHFDKAYIDELDVKIQTYSAVGARVYLQLLLPSNSTRSTLLGADGAESGASYDMPDVYDEDTLSRLSTYVRFLASRYDTYAGGLIGGIILGKQIDIYQNSFNGGLSVEEYAKKYAFYLTVVANSARIENPDINIVIPFSNFNSYDNDKVNSEYGYQPSILLENIIMELDELFSSSFRFSTLIESDSCPIRESNDTTNSEIYSFTTNENKTLGVNNIAVYDKFLSDIDEKYRSAPSGFIYLWNVPNGFSGNILECSYAYSYYTLISGAKVSSFVVSFENCNDGVLESVESLVEYIDTQEGLKESNELLKYFGASKWSDIVNGFSDKNLVLRTLYTSADDAFDDRPWIGGFSYLDFSAGNINGWVGGAYSKKLKSEYGSDGRRALRQIVNRPSGQAHSDLYHLYEYNENLIYTPLIKFDVEVTDGEESLGALYEITVTIGYEKNSVSRNYVVRSGEITELWLNVSEYSNSNTASYIKISSRSISGSNEEYSVWLYDAVGYSDTYDNEELDRLISAERAYIRNQTDHRNDGSSDDLLYWIVFLIVIVAITIGGIMVTVIRRDDGSIKEKTKRLKK